MPGHEALTLEGQVPVVEAAERGVDRVTLADELVHAEGERRCTAVGIQDTAASHQVGPDGVGTALRGLAGLLGERGRRSARAADGLGHPSDQPIVLVVDAEGGLDPARQRICGQGLERGGDAARIADAGGELRTDGRICEVDWPGRPAQRLTEHVIGGHRGAEDPAGDAGDRCTLVGQRPFAGQGGRRAHELQVRRPARLPRPPRQQRDVGTLAAPVGVQLVEDQELQPLGGPHQPAVPHPSEDQLQHHIVGEDHVGRIAQQDVPLLAVELARIAAHPDRPPTVEAMVKELRQLLGLAVGQGVHRIDDDGLHRPAAAVPQHVVHDRHQVRQALARPGAGGQHVALSRRRGPDRLDLVPVQPHRAAVRVVGALADAEHPLAVTMQQALLDEVADVGPRLECWVQPDRRLGPQPVQVVGHPVADPFIPHGHEALDVAAVLADQLVSQVENVHRSLPHGPCAELAATQTHLAAWGTAVDRHGVRWLAPADEMINRDGDAPAYSGAEPWRRPPVLVAARRHCFDHHSVAVRPPTSPDRTDRKC